MSYFVKICSKCKAANHPSMTFCAKCGADLPSEKTESETKPVQPPAYAVQAVQQDEGGGGTGSSGTANNDGPIACRVVDVDMPFWSMVTFMVKFSMASIPALIIITIYAVFALAILAAVGYGIGQG